MKALQVNSLHGFFVPMPKLVEKGVLKKWWNIVTGDNLIARMGELNTGFWSFISDILADRLVKFIVDISVMTSPGR